MKKSIYELLLMFVLAFGFLGQIRDELLARGTLRHMAELLHELAVLLRDSIKEILDDHGMESAGRRADGKDLVHLKQNNGAVLRRYDIMQKRTAVRCGICFAEHITDTDHIDDTTIAPIIVLLDMDTAFRYDGNTVDVLSLTEDIFSFCIGTGLRLQTAEHRTEIFFAYP